MTRKTNISYKIILKRIKSHIDQRTQWLEMDSLARALEYEHQAYALIELLEIQTCGSTGGFDSDGEVAQQWEPQYRTLEGRYLWIKERYGAN